MTDFLSVLFNEDTDETATPTIQRVLQFQIKKFVLQALLDKALTAVPTRDVMPVLKCFQLQVETQRLRVIATDLEMSLIASTPMVTVQWPGVAVFPAKKLVEIIRTAEDADVTVRVLGSTATITIGRASWTLKLQGGQDFPPMPAITEAEFTTVDRQLFADALQAVRYAASRDPSRANLGIIDITDGKLTAADGSRIQQITISDFPVNLRIPISAVDHLLRLLKISDLDTVDVGQSELKLIFRFASDVYIVSKFFAQFPDIEAQMLRPALENKHTLDVDRAELLAAIKRVRINADPETSAIALHLDTHELTVSAKDKFNNTATQTVFCSFTGSPRTVVLNHKFLLDMIATYGDATCNFRIGDDTKTRRCPVLLRHAATGRTGVVQQMLIDWAL